MQKVSKRYVEIRECLVLLTEEDDQSARAQELLEEMSSFKFIIILRIMKKILKCINCVYVELQCASILLPSAINLVNSTKNDLNNLRNDEVFNQIFEKCKKYASKYDFIIDEDESKNIKRKRNIAFNKNLNNYLVDSTLGKFHKPELMNNIKFEIFFSV